MIVQLARAEPTCKDATVLWGLDAATYPQTEPESQIDPADLALARSAAMQTLPVFSANGHRLAVPLFPTDPAVLLLAIAGLTDGRHFIDEMSAQLKVAGRHLSRALELTELQTSLKRLERSERLQRALFAISDLAGSDRHMPDMLRGVQFIVGTLMYAMNFFIVLHNAERDTLRFLYFSDVEDPKPRNPDLEIPMHTRANSLTWYVLRDGKPLMGSIEQMRAQVSGPLT